MDLIFTTLQQPLAQRTANEAIHTKDQDLFLPFLLHALVIRSSESHFSAPGTTPSQVAPCHVNTALGLAVADHNGNSARRNRQWLGRDYRPWQIPSASRPTSRASQKKHFLSPMKLKAPGNGFVTARTRFLTSRAVLNQSIAPSAG